MTRLTTNIIANFSGQIWALLLNIILVPVYLFYLGIEAYGLIGFFASLQAIISLIDMGLRTTANRQIARIKANPSFHIESRNLIKTLEYFYFSTGFLIILIFYFASSYISSQWLTTFTIPRETIKIAIIIFGTSFAFRWPVALYNGLLSGMEKQVLLNFAMAGMSTVRGIGSVFVIAFVAQSIIGFLIWQLISAAGEIIFMRWISLNSLPSATERPIFDNGILRNIWRFSVSVGFTSIFAAILKQLDKILISKLLSLEQLGYYMTASVLVMAINSMIVGPISNAVFPRFSSIISQDNSSGLSEIFHRSARMVSFLTAPITVVLFFFSHEILYVWTRSEAIAANVSNVLAILAFATMLNSMMQIPFMLQLAFGLTWLPLVNNIIAVCLLAPLIVVFVSNYGIIGGAMAWTIFNVLYYLIMPHITHHYILRNDKWSWILLDTIPFLIVSILLFGSLYVASSYIKVTFVTYSLVIFGGLLYPVVILLMHKSFRQDVSYALSNVVTASSNRYLSSKYITAFSNLLQR